MTTTEWHAGCPSCPWCGAHRHGGVCEAEARTLRQWRQADMWYACHVVDRTFGRGSPESRRAWQDYQDAGGTGN